LLLGSARILEEGETNESRLIDLGSEIDAKICGFDLGAKICGSKILNTLVSPKMLCYAWSDTSDLKFVALKCVTSEL